MPTITIKTLKSHAVHEWMQKEYGSWEDSNCDADHACALLQKFGGTITLTIEQAKNLIVSGKYQSTAWNEDEISGGKRTMRVIAKYVRLISDKLEEAQPMKAFNKAQKAEILEAIRLRRDTVEDDPESGTQYERVTKMYGLEYKIKEGYTDFNEHEKEWLREELGNAIQLSEGAINDPELKHKAKGEIKSFNNALDKLK